MAGSLKSYANTSVGAGRTKEQIESLLKKVGAIGFRWDSALPYGKEFNGGAVGFEQLSAMIQWHSRKLAFRLRIEYDTERQQRQNLRALYWYLKAKIEAIEFGIVDLEQEFMPYMLAPSGRTLYDELGGSNLKLLSAPEEKE
jgi:hypothetical protein